MKSFIHKITDTLTAVSQYLVTFGAFGLFAIALLDSALIPMAGGPDAVLLLLAAKFPSYWPFYAAAATLGSTAGCVILYYLSARAGRSALKRFSEKKQKRVKDLLDRYDVLSVLVASILPPPFPFKLFVVSAGVFRLNVLRFAVAVAIGRAFRYLLEGYLAARYGEHAKEWLAHYYPVIGIGLAVLIVVGFVARNLLRRKKTAGTEQRLVEEP
ncbi:MAG TPA: VTT domain-containing protein [Pyrinomonadaceae bacterium]|nr:VTT domain-containing protein [Pyrinomonadaceae bacterium]